LPPEVLGSYPPGTLFTVDHSDGAVRFVPDLPAEHAQHTPKHAGA
jgi:hypothetical protein